MSEPEAEYLEAKFERSYAKLGIKEHKREDRPIIKTTPAPVHRQDPPSSHQTHNKTRQPKLEP